MLRHQRGDHLLDEGRCRLSEGLQLGWCLVPVTGKEDP